MRKQMKKTSIFAAAMILTLGAAATVHAEDSGKLYAVTDAQCENLGNMNPQTGKGEEQEFGIMGLGPEDLGNGTFSDAKITFTVPVDTAGIYTIKVHHAAKEGAERKADIIINGERSSLNITTHGDWVTYSDAEVEAHLNSGNNSVVLVNDSNFDNSTIKSINIDYITYELKTADVSDKQESSDKDADEQKPSDNNTNTEKDSDKKPDSNETTSVKTGDTAGVNTFVFALASGFAAMFIVFKTGRAKKK